VRGGTGYTSPPTNRTKPTLETVSVTTAAHLNRAAVVNVARAVAFAFARIAVADAISGTHFQGVVGNAWTLHALLERTNLPIGYHTTSNASCQAKHQSVRRSHKGRGENDGKRARRTHSHTHLVATTDHNETHNLAVDNVRGEQRGRTTHQNTRLRKRCNEPAAQAHGERGHEHDGDRNKVPTSSHPMPRTPLQDVDPKRTRRAPSGLHWPCPTRCTRVRWGQWPRRSEPTRCSRTHTRSGA